ncbi:MAG: type II toxin-antitoxin system RelE/ParE family toxin [Pyrinomonadaceae bacterium]
MTSRTTEKFWKAFAGLPPSTQRKARAAYQLWQHNPYHPSLQFKQIHARKPIYSVRVGIGWRAVGVKDDDTVIWFWIGSHADYDSLIAQL